MPSLAGWLCRDLVRAVRYGTQVEPVHGRIIPTPELPRRRLSAAPAPSGAAAPPAPSANPLLGKE